MTNTIKISENGSLLTKFLYIISSFLLAVCITILSLLLSFKFGFISQSQIFNALSDATYYTPIYESLMSNCENEALVSGLSSDIFDDCFRFEKLKGDSITYMTATLNDETYTIDTDEMQETLSKNIRTYTEENNLTVDGDLDSIIASFTDTVIAYYKTSIAFPYLSEIASFFRLFDKLMRYILPCVTIFALILLVVIYRLNGYKKNRFFRYLAYSLLSGAISTLVIPIFCYINGFYKHISFTQEYVYRFVVKYFENGLRYFAIAGIVLAICGILSIITSCVIKSRLKKEHVAANPSHSHSEA
jgi:hypothetical protein